jgi:hypothetical protein
LIMFVLYKSEEKFYLNSSLNLFSCYLFLI